MASLSSLYHNKKQEAGYGSNLKVDYVIHYDIPKKTGRHDAEAAYVQLIQELTTLGLATEVRPGDSGTSLLIFVRIGSEEVISSQVYRARLQDWLHGVRTTSPEKLSDEPVSHAERLRLVYLMITKPKSEGGAGVTPGTGQWKYVISIFPLHNHPKNQEWIQKLSRKYILDNGDLDEIRHEFGERVGLYFAFMQAYFLALIFPTAFGIVAWLVWGPYSMIYALGNCLWSVIFVEYWKVKEGDLAVQWGVRGVSEIQHYRPQFKADFETKDPSTGEVKKMYSPFKRLGYQMMQVPFIAAATLAFSAMFLFGTSLEIFINEVYDGAFKMYLSLLPTIVMAVMTPTLSAVLSTFAAMLNDIENYETVDVYEAALVQKQFVINFFTSYMPLFLTAFIYMPFSHILMPFLDMWHSAAKAVTFGGHEITAREFHVNRDRIGQQMFYLTITAQLVNVGTEIVLPYVKRMVFSKVKEVQADPATRNAHDDKDESSFLNRIRSEAELDHYDVTTDYREMVVQFGYVTLFSVASPLAACCFLVNNWFEIRGDALKIAIGSRHPIPLRADSLGAWLNAMEFLTWLGSLTSVAVVHLSSTTGLENFDAVGFLVTLIIAENVYFAAKMLVRFVMGKTDSVGRKKIRETRFLMKRKLLKNNLNQEADDHAAVPGLAASQTLIQTTLKEEADKGLDSPEDIFWHKQTGMDNTVLEGRQWFEQKVPTSPSPSPKAQ